MADHPLRPATDRSLGGLLPHQQANQTQIHPLVIAEATFDHNIQGNMITSGISTVFTALSQSIGQIIYALLTRSPVYLFPKKRSPKTCMC